MFPRGQGRPRGLHLCVIDHIYVNSMSISHVIPTIVSKDISDHFPIFAEFISKLSKKSAKRPYMQENYRKKILIYFF